MITLSPPLEALSSRHDDAMPPVKTARTGESAGSLPARGESPGPKRFERTLECAICVVGADLAGLLIACDLASRGYDVALFPLEDAADESFDSAFAPGFALPTSDLVTHLGREDAGELMSLSGAAAEKGMAYAAQAGLAPGPRGRLAVARPDVAAALETEHRVREELLPHSSLLLTAQDTQALLGTSAFSAALGVVPAQRVNVATLRAVLIEAARQSEVRIMDTSGGISADVQGPRKHILAGGVRVRTSIVVFSGGLSLRGIAPAFASGLIATPHVCGHFEVPADEEGYHGLVEEAGPPGLRFYRAGSQLHVCAETAMRVRTYGGAARVLRRHARAARPEVAGQTALDPRAVMLARTRERMPLVHEGEPGVWYCATLGDAEPAHGVLAADLIVGAIAEGDDRVRLLQPFGLAAATRSPESRLEAILSYGYARVSRMIMPMGTSPSATPRALPPPASSGQARTAPVTPPQESRD